MRIPIKAEREARPAIKNTLSKTPRINSKITAHNAI
jgi:hypothetical protein